MVSRNIVEVVEGLVSPVLEQEGLELVDVTFGREGRRWVLRIFIDKPGGVTLDDCAWVSHRIEDLIEVEEVISQRYYLEISSPGLDRVLKKERDFQRFAGKWARVRIREPMEGRRNFKGRILGCEQGMLDLEDSEGRRFRFPLGEIEKARLDFREEP